MCFDFPLNNESWIKKILRLVSNCSISGARIDCPSGYRTGWHCPQNNGNRYTIKDEI